MPRHVKIIDRAVNEALNSTQTFKHGAVILDWGKIICLDITK